MTDVFDGLDALDAKIEGLENSLGGAQSVVSTFDGELSAMRQSWPLTA